MTDIIQLNPAEYGLQENKAKEIANMFKPMLDKMVELETEYNEIVKLEINPETCDKAKELRLRYVKVRTGTAAIHKELKNFYLQGGRFVDGWKNAQLMASQGIEEKLMNIEKHFENIEKERIAKLQAERALELTKYEFEPIPNNIGEMSDAIWGNFIAGAKLAYDNKIEAERKAEADRLEAERLAKLNQERKNETARLADFIPDYYSILFSDLEDEKYNDLKESAEKAKKEKEAEQEKIRLENLRLQKEAEEKEKARIKNEKKLKAKQEAERKKAEAQLKAEREAREKVEREEKAKREKLEAELKAKQEAEALAEKQRQEAIEAELAKGDTDKLNDLIADLELLKTKYQFESKANKAKYEGVKNLLTKVVAYINE